MSSPAALATVTATLRHLLDQATSGADVTTKPPAAARNGASNNQLNLFLYGTHINTAFSNAPMPGQSTKGESGLPPLSLVLKYLLTAYGDNDDDIAGQQLLGQAMSVFHDHPLLGKADIEGILPDSKLQHQIERLRITPDALSLDDMSKLWTSFQAEYRLSTAYEVSVVLIESNRVSPAPLPVLKRGEQNRGAAVLASPSPTLTGIRFPHQKPSAELGDRLTLLGNRMAGAIVTLRLRHPLLDDPIHLQPEPDRSDTQMPVQLPGPSDDPQVGATWPAGFYTLSLVIERPDAPAWTTNALSFALSPRITGINPTQAPQGDVALTVTALPQIREQQHVALLFGDRAVAVDSLSTPADPTAPTTLTFTVENAEARSEPYVLRLRVDGVDSLPIDFSGETPRFADDQKVEIT